MKTQFKVGDRVRVEGNSQLGIELSGLRGQVELICDPKSWINIRLDKPPSGYCDYFFTVHRRNCIKLKPRPKSVCITKEMLAKAFSKYYNNKVTAEELLKNTHGAFCKLANELGL